MEVRELIKIAIDAREKSYSPYSNFKVGAALLTKSGKIFTGCNVESVAFSPTMCAERTAIVKAVSEGEREFHTLVVIGGHSDGRDPGEGYAGPCGVCRQFIIEFGKEIKVVIAKSEEEYYEHTILDFMPMPFAPEALL